LVDSVVGQLLEQTKACQDDFVIVASTAIN